MRVNERPYDEDVTEHLLNSHAYAQHVRLLVDAWARLRMNLGLPSTSLFRTMFGQERERKLYTNRNAIWTFCNDDATVWTLVSKAGVSWEHDKRSDVGATVDILEELYARINSEMRR